MFTEHMYHDAIILLQREVKNNWYCNYVKEIRKRVKQSRLVLQGLSCRCSGVEEEVDRSITCTSGTPHTYSGIRC